MLRERVGSTAVVLLLFALPWSGCRGQAAPDKVSCAVDNTAPNEADKALLDRRYQDAERLYGEMLAKSPGLDTAEAGVVRALVGEEKLADALALATKDNADRAKDPVLLDALGDVRFRRGEVDEAANAWNQAMRLDRCYAYTHYEVYRFLSLSGMYATAQRQLDLAHTLWPANREIEQLWFHSHAKPQTAEQTLAWLKQRAGDPSLSDEDKQGIQMAIKGLESREKGDCEPVAAVTEAKLPMVPISEGAAWSPQDIYAAGLDLQINGKRRRLEIDTGASGLLLSRSAAKSLGLAPELEFKEGGIGDKGSAAAFVAHVDDIRIGPMEFRNCVVRVLEENRDAMGDIDGLIGPDVFRDYLVTLDIPGREVRIGPLPARPGDAPGKPPSLVTSDSDDMEQSDADRARDRYIAPEMKDWDKVFRSGHFLIFPTWIGNAPVKLFVMDTGAAQTTITPAAAREVTHVSSDDDATVSGLSGQVKTVMAANAVTITFGGVRQQTLGMRSYDSRMFTEAAGAEISGLIGFPTLRELVISIDYRDNLVHVVYDPKKGYHMR